MAHSHEVEAVQEATPAPPLLTPAPPAGAAMTERVLSLQRSAGNQAVSRMLAQRRAVARWTMPLHGRAKAGKKKTSLADFIKIIRAEEDKLPEATRLNTKLMITKLRKLFYGSGGWDSYLIPDASGIDPLYKFKEVDDSRREFEGPGPNVIEFVDRHPELEGAPSQLTKPGEIQEVEMPDGDFVDVGHVLAGLDALNHPSTVSAFGMYKMSSNVSAVTWAGDLGSILAEWIFQRAKKGSALSDSELQKEVDEFAPLQDMVGNIDAYVIGDTFNISDEGPGGSRTCTPGKRVSDILLEYYGGPGVATSTGAAARAKRFTIFAKKVGLGTLSGGSFTNETKWINDNELEVGKAAALYVGATSVINKLGLTWSVGAKLGLMDATRDSPDRRVLLVSFVNQLKYEVAGEASSP